jgi:hypothetical protein
MICGKCYGKFRYTQIPYKKRVYTKWYAIVLCPHCGTKLKPKRLHIVALHSCLISLCILCFLFLFEILNLAVFHYIIYAILVIVSVVTFILGLSIKNTDIVN